MPWSLAARAGVLAAAATAFVLGGCGDSDEDAPPTSQPAPLAPTTATAPSSSSPAPSPTSAPDAARTIQLELAQDNVVGGPRRETVSVGETVVLRATSDVAEELHVHTYDVRTHLAPGEPAEVRFTADIPGRHEVEFEKSGKIALTLEVR